MKNFISLLKTKFISQESYFLKHGERHRVRSKKDRSNPSFPFQTKLASKSKISNLFQKFASRLSETLRDTVNNCRERNDFSI